MSVTRPNTDQLIDLAADLGMTLSADEAAEYLTLMAGNFAAYDALDAMPDNIPVVKYPRTPGYRPEGAENKYGAWYVKSEVKGAATGKLAGKTVVLKDNVALAGVPMMNGASTLEGYVPALDATIVTRMLDEGATIVGKATCEYFCLSGGSHTSSPAPVHNPYKMGHIAGGSSSGSAALVACGEVDMAIGGDQGGSIRMPSALCGLYGMKPTHGLVPYTGVMPIEATIDHTGPMTSSVADNALMLEVIAGADGLDPRQYAPVTAPYTEALGKGVQGMKIAILKEGFEVANGDPAVYEKVRAAAKKLEEAGAVLTEISIPEHHTAAVIWGPIALEGLQWQMMAGNGMGMNWKGLYNVGLLDAHAGWRQRADELSPSLKISMFIGEYFIQKYNGRFYAKAQNIARKVKAAYDAAFAEYDLLLMPTCPIVAPAIPAADASLTEIITTAFSVLGNTQQFDVTGHPAMTVPCGLIDGLPVGMMLVGKDYAESTIYAAAAAFEAAGDWKTF
ncbi:amidase [Tistrella mobilis]|uniref:amidase n=1 Tax=Tistrella mobilis TaxID=171437 RepID=UPI0026833F03